MRGDGVDRDGRLRGVEEDGARSSGACDGYGELQARRRSLFCRQEADKEVLGRFPWRKKVVRDGGRE